MKIQMKFCVLVIPIKILRTAPDLLISRAYIVLSRHLDPL